MRSGEVELEPWVFVQPDPQSRVFVGGVVVDDQVNRQIVGDLVIDGAQELHELLMTVAGQTLSDDRAGEHVESGEQRRGAVPLVIVGHRLRAARDHRQRGLGAVQGLHRGLLVRAQHDRPSGGFRYSPTTSTNFSSKRGSLDSLNVSTRCGFKPHANHTRCTVSFETPTGSAIVRQLQCVWPAGR